MCLPPVKNYQLTFEKEIYSICLSIYRLIHMYELIITFFEQKK